LRKLADMLKQLLRTRLPIVIGLIAATGCSTSHTNTAASSTTTASSATAVSPATTASPPPGSTTNGRSIFQTGKDGSGLQIDAREPPLFRSCAACHRADGSGGVHLPGGAVSADLRHAALLTNQHKPYTIALLERAISTGIDNTGASLNPVMPRWKLSKQDLHAVAYYVFTELK
jgi:mono/diheme cytochrome c family protein